MGVCERDEDFRDGELDPVFNEGPVDFEQGLQLLEVNLVDALSTEDGESRSCSVLEQGRCRKSGKTLDLGRLEGGVGEEERGENYLPRFDVERRNERVNIRVGEVCGTEVRKSLEEDREAGNAACFALGVDVA